MFGDLIEMLLKKKAEVIAVVDKIDKLLEECGYVEPVNNENCEGEVASYELEQGV